MTQKSQVKVVIDELGEEIDKIKTHKELFEIIKEKTTLCDESIKRGLRKAGYGSRYFRARSMFKHKSVVNYGGLEGFKMKFDKSLIIPQKIENGIDTVLKKNGWMYDVDFREKCGVSSSDWRRYADNYENLQAKAEGKLVWGHPDIIEEMKGILGT